ncbi:MAG: hypothetical protein U0L59_05055 [Faecalimonas sp.]|nr:hypothetical protein [Faecalimonas sp.]
MNKAKKKNKSILIGVMGILILLFVVLMGNSCEPELAISEYETNVNQITEIDMTKRQEELNAIVEEGKMNVNYSSWAVFNGTVSENFNIKNIKNNHYPIEFELFDENGDCIYTSKKIEPGYEMNMIELDRALSKGTHECRLKVGYAEEGNVSSAFPITIEVK